MVKQPFLPFRTLSAERDQKFMIGDRKTEASVRLEKRSESNSQTELYLSSIFLARNHAIRARRYRPTWTIIV